MRKLFLPLTLLLVNVMLVYSQEVFSIWRLHLFIRHKTGDLYFTDEMENYGCWCGRRGQGLLKDQLDRCCYIHFKCLEQTQCPDSSILYSSTQCIPGKTITCNDEDRCKREFCSCDVNAVDCLIKYKTLYNATLKHGDKSYC